MIEFLEQYVHTNPSQILNWLGQFIRAGRQTGFHYETLATSRIVYLIKLYLTDYRDVIQEENQVITVDTLDALIESGTTDAINLTYRLNELFR